MPLLRICCSSRAVGAVMALFCCRCFLLLLLFSTTAFAEETGADDAAAAAAAVSGGNPSSPTAVLAHLVFASCNRQHSDQSFWSTSITHTIARQRGVSAEDASTDALLWVGNAVYAGVSTSGVELNIPSSIPLIESEYAQLVKNRHYSAFVQNVVRRRGGRVMGIWDDQDLGLRGAGRNYSQTTPMKEVYMNFLGASPSEREEIVTHDGLYRFSTIPVAPASPLAARFVNSICVVTLDVRSQRGEYSNFDKEVLRFGRDPDARKGDPNVERDDLLGVQQWAWLEGIVASYLSAGAKDVVGRSTCAVALIATPWQVLLNDNKPFVGWDLYPHSRTRLVKLLRRHRVERFLFLSGHAELGELGILRRAKPSEMEGEGFYAPFIKQWNLQPPTQATAALLPSAPHVLVEVTSAGLTHNIAEAPVVGRLFRLISAPGFDEGGRTTNLLVPRHIVLQRSTVLERSFGTVQLRMRGKYQSDEAAPIPAQELDRAVVVVVTVHAVKDGTPLLTYEAALRDLPTFNDEDEAEAVDEQAGVWNGKEAYFAMYNTRTEYPLVKRFALHWSCEELPCVPGRLFIFVQVAIWLAVAFFVLMLGLVAFVFVQRYMMWKELETEKPKKD